jgi:hypothetical protein
MDRIMAANKLYVENCASGGGRNDAMAMQYLIPGWKFDPKRPCMANYGNTTSYKREADSGMSVFRARD